MRGEIQADADDADVTEQTKLVMLITLSLLIRPSLLIILMLLTIPASLVMLITLIKPS